MPKEMKKAKRLGQILLDKGVITQDQLAAAMAKKAGSGKTYFSSLGDLLIHKGHATPEQIQEALAEQRSLE